MLRQDFVDIFQAFYDDNIDLSCFNKALVPKMTGARRVGDFRRICLVNGILKVTSKVLACRLKTKISALIEPSQSAFLQGRSILDSVTTAQEIISACTKNKWPAFFLKLDYAKAFDTIDWTFLIKVLQARGFSVKWCSWIHSLHSSGFSSVLVDGQPGSLLGVNVV